MTVSDRLEKAKARLDAYYEAELAVLAGQEYKIGSRSLTRADLGEIKNAIRDLENLIEELEAQVNGQGRRRAYRITLRDL
jgi:benzoyl-CoA reductase/2-hydroxyglutaryl-CoA dehydratase subunit BcrC/BadD/HgdB